MRQKISKNICTKKKLSRVILAAAALFAAVGFGGMKAEAAGGSDYKSAKTITFDETYSGSIDNTGVMNYHYEYYTFSMPTSGKVSFKMTGDCDFFLDDEADSSKMLVSGWKDGKDYYLLKGDYYLRLRNSARYSSRIFKYEFSISYEDSEETVAESKESRNDGIKTAWDLEMGKKYTGQLGENDDSDYYVFELDKPSRIEYSLRTTLGWIRYYIRRADEQVVTWDGWGGNSSAIKLDNPTVKTGTIDLRKGTYYLQIERSGDTTHPTPYGGGIYDVKFTATEAEESFPEVDEKGSDNDVNHANEITVNKEYSGQLAADDSDDYYKVDVPENDGVFEVVGSSTTASSIAVYIYSKDGKELKSKTFKANDMGILNFSLGDIEASSTYYIRFATADPKITGNYTFTAKATPKEVKVSEIKLDQSSVSLYEEESIKLNAVVNPDNADNREIKWSSNNPKVAEVDKEGNVTAKGSGSATITAEATDESGVKATCTVKVVSFGTYTGLKEGTDGSILCVSNGKIQKDYTGLWNDEKLGFRYVENGKVNTAYNGFANYADAWWVVYGGQVYPGYTGLWGNDAQGWWYAENGTINLGYNGYAAFGDSWWAVAGGKVYPEFTGIWGNESMGWWYAENGRINFAYNGFAPLGSSWRVVASGRVYSNYTGLWGNDAQGWWYAKNGSIDVSYNGTVAFAGLNWNVVNGQVVF